MEIRYWHFAEENKSVPEILYLSTRETRYVYARHENKLYYSSLASALRLNSDDKTNFRLCSDIAIMRTPDRVIVFKPLPPRLTKSVEELYADALD